MKQLTGAAVLLLLFLSPADADMTILVTRSGNDVEFFGTGSIDLDGLSFLANGLLVSPGIDPSTGFSFGSTENLPNPVEVYLGEVLGPDSFGTGTEFLPANSGLGDSFGLGFGGDVTTIAVPDGYVTGSELTNSIIFENATFNSLNVSPGEYIWTVGNNTIQMNIIPETRHGLLAVDRFPGSGYKKKTKQVEPGFDGEFLANPLRIRKCPYLFAW